MTLITKAGSYIVFAVVAELADAHGSGPCGLTPVEVRVLSTAYLLYARPVVAPAIAGLFCMFVEKTFKGLFVQFSRGYHMAHNPHGTLNESHLHGFDSYS